MPDCFADPPTLEGTPDVKTRACICVIFYRHVLCFSSTRDAPGAAGVYARRLPLLSTTIGRRCGGPAVLSTAPAKTQFRLSKGILEPRPVAGSTAERDSFLPNTSWPGSPTFAKASADSHRKARRSLGAARSRPSTLFLLSVKTWMAGAKPGHDEKWAKRGAPL